MKTAGDERADKIEGEDQHAVRQAGMQQAGGVREPEVRGDAGMRKKLDVFAPAEGGAQQLDARKGRAVHQVAGVMVAGERIEAADAVIAAGDDDRGAGGTPGSGRNAGGQLAQTGQPAGREGFFHGSGQGERDGIAAIAAEHRLEGEGAAAGEQRGGGRGRIAERGETLTRREAHGKLIGRRVHARRLQAPAGRARR